VTKKTVIIVVIALAAVGIALYVFNRLKPAPKAADLLPDSTLLYISVPDFPRSRQDFAHSELYALWQEPEVQAFLEKPRAALREVVGAGKSDSVLEQFFQDRVVGLLEGEVFLGVTSLKLTAFQSGIIAGADVKQKKLEAEAFLKLVEHDLARHFPNSTATEKRYLGTDYIVWQLTGKNQVCHAFLNSLLVFTGDEDTLRDVITRFAKQAPPNAKPLAASASFQKTLKQLPAGHEAVAYLNVKQLLGVFGPLLALSPQTGGFFQKVANIEASATSVTFADGLVEDFSLIQYSGTNHVAEPPIERRTLVLTAPDTSVYAVYSVELAAAYRQTMDALAISGNATLTAAATEFDRGLRQRGLHFADDVLANVGPELALIGNWREGASHPDVALVAEVKNADALRPKLDIAMEALKDAAPSASAKNPWESQSYLGTSIRSLPVGDGVVSPSYVVTDKFLILSLTADYARTLVAQSKGSGPTLVDNSVFTEALCRVPAASTSLTYCDVRSLFVPLYALALAHAAPNEFVDFGKLPKAETLAKHLAPFISATVDTRTAQITTTFSTLGKPLTFVVGIAGVLGAAQPSLAGLIPMWPTLSSGSLPAGNRTAPSQTPTP
jgi:hypothetical protein